MYGHYGMMGSSSGSHPPRPLAKHFSGDSPPMRIIGTELEYKIQNFDSQNRTVPHGNYISEQAIRAAGIKSIRGYTNLGSRIYTDVGHAEYCTPECKGPYEAAAADIAGIAIMSSIINASGFEHQGVFRVSGMWMSEEDDILKGVVPNITNGVHENFMMPSTLAKDKLLPLLLPSYYATRIASMAGTISLNRYEFSQKAVGIGGTPYIAHGIVRRTDAGKKPMALILDAEGETMTSDWMRLETRYADAPLSIAARRHALASTSLVLRILEQQDKFDPSEFEDIIIKDPLVATYRMMADLSLKTTVEVVSGKQMNVLDINEMFVEKVRALSNRVSLPDDEKKHIDVWMQINDAYRRSKPEKVEYDPFLVRDYPVTTKHIWLHRQGTFAKGDGESKTRSLQWDRILPIGNGIKMMEKSSITDPNVEKFQHNAPTGRARVRAEFINDYADEQNRVSTLSWRKATTTYNATTHFGNEYGTLAP